MITASLGGLCLFILNTVSRSHAVLRNKIEEKSDIVRVAKELGILFMQRKKVESVSGAMSRPHIRIRYIYFYNE